MADETRDAWYRVAKIGTSVLPWFTILGLLATWVFSIINSRQDRISRDWDRMGRSLQQLGGGSPYERLGGVIGVSSFLTSTQADQRSQAELALSNALAIEESETVRQAIVSVSENINPKIVRTPELDRMLSLLVQVSRRLTQEGLLWSNRASRNFSLNRPQDGSAEARAEDVADSIAILPRKGARPADFSGTYLVRSDFSKLNLAHSNFNNSILSWSDFSDSVLNDASFDGADLEGVNFVESDLRRAKLTFKPLSAGMRIEYALREFSWPWPSDQGPDLWT